MSSKLPTTRPDPLPLSKHPDLVITVVNQNSSPRPHPTSPSSAPSSYSSFLQEVDKWMSDIRTKIRALENQHRNAGLSGATPSGVKIDGGDLDSELDADSETDTETEIESDAPLSATSFATVKAK